MTHSITVYTTPSAIRSILPRRITLYACAVALIALPVQYASSQGTMRVAPSGRATTEVVLTFADSAARAAAKPAVVRIDYGQPHLRGRSINTDSLVPYDKAWRLGANGATMLTTDVDLMIGGASVPKGTYVLQALPSQSGWKLLVQMDMSASPMAAAMTYDPKNDVARIDFKKTILQLPIESLTMWLIPSTTAGSAHGELRMAWGTTMLSTSWSVK